MRAAQAKQNAKRILSISGVVNPTLSTSIVDRFFKTVLAIGLSYVPSTGLSKHDRTKETQGAFG